MSTGTTDKVDRVLASINTAKWKQDARQEDIRFLNDLLASSDFKALVKVHDCVSSAGALEVEPVSATAAQSAKYVVDALNVVPESYRTEAQALRDILASPHFMALLSAHDTLAKTDFLMSGDGEVAAVAAWGAAEDGRRARVVRLQKTDAPLGCTIKAIPAADGKATKIVIGRILVGGAAHQSGAIKAGDELLEINGVSVTDKSVNDVVQIMSSLDGEVVFKLIPTSDGASASSPAAAAPSAAARKKLTATFIRAQFDYNPLDDDWLPCREGGLAFKCGDVLQVLSTDDPNWWQASMEGRGGETRIGLIPGTILQERRPRAEMTDSPTGKGSPAPSLEAAGKRSSLASALGIQELGNRPPNPTYEEVVQMRPLASHPRPLILIGAPGVGRNMIKRRLLADYHTEYATTIPHTTRPRKAGEVDGKEYFFTTREKMEEDIRNNRFVEHGEYHGHLYGTSLQTILNIIASRKTCVLDIHPKTLRLLRTADVKPLVVFVKPPNLRRLRDTRNGIFPEEKLVKMLTTSTKYETYYGHLFDESVVNDNLDAAVREIHAQVMEAQEKVKWVPASWVQIPAGNSTDSEA